MQVVSSAVPPARVVRGAPLPLSVQISYDFKLMGDYLGAILSAQVRSTPHTHARTRIHGRHAWPAFGDRPPYGDWSEPQQCIRARVLPGTSVALSGLSPSVSS